VYQEYFGQSRKKREGQQKSSGMTGCGACLGFAPLYSDILSPHLPEKLHVSSSPGEPASKSQNNAIMPLGPAHGQNRGLPRARKS
jgi:hypothetical protein